MPRLIFHCAARYTGSAVIEAVDLTDRAERLVELDDHIREAGEPILKEDDVWEAEVEPGLPVWKLLFEDQRDLLSRDLSRSLQLALDQSASITADQLDECVIQGTLGLFPGGDATQLDQKCDLRTLVRAHMDAEPGDAAAFCEDCGIAFPRLLFSESFPACVATFDGGHHLHAGVLVRCLAALNDDWPTWDGGDLPQALRAFSAQCGFTTTLEGDGDRKDALTFSFKVEEGRSERVLCEPHMKLGSSDKAGDNTYHFHRIYFCPRPHPLFAEKLLVGHAGKHL